MNEPNVLTPAERNWDEVLRFENRERYVQQSAATVAGQRAELPPRARPTHWMPLPPPPAGESANG